MAADLYFRGEKRASGVWTGRAKRGASALRGVLGPGARVGVLLPNGFDFIEAYRAITWAGLTSVPISTHLNPDDYRALSEREQLDGIITSTFFDPSWRSAPSMPRWLVDADPASDASSWEQFIAAAPEISTTAAAPLHTFFTSGSTKTPKTVVREVLPPDVAGLRQARFVDAWGMKERMRTVITGPMYHQAPLYYAMGALDLAERIVLLDTFEPEDVLYAISEHEVTHLHLVPRLMRKLASVPEDTRAQFNVSSLKFALHGAARCQPSDKHALIEWWGPIFREYYATSEFGIVTQIDCDEWLERPSSVGRPFQGVELEIRHVDTGASLPSQQLGRVFMRSDDMPTFHYRGERGSDVPRTRGEWITVNDVGYLDEDGYLHLTGRADGIAVISGMNFSSDAVLAALLELSYVSEALVYVVHDQERGHAFATAVVLRPGFEQVTPTQIQRDLSVHLRPLQVPRDVQTVNSLPILDTGKTVPRYMSNLAPIADRRVMSERDDVLAGRTPPPPFFPAQIDVVAKGSTGSTNTDAIALAPTAGRDTLVWAERQSAGRGRQARTWFSEPGNVYWTMLVQTEQDPPHSTGLVFVTALAVLSTVRALTPGDRRVETKWPNDTLIDGRKVSGVLIESAQGPHGRMRAVGIGVNVDSYPTTGLMYEATCLRAEGSAAHRNDVLTLLTANFLAYLDLWRRQGFSALREQYVRSAYKFGQTISIRLSKESYVSGVFSDVTEAGVHLLMPDGTTKLVSAGDLLGGTP